LSDELDYLLAYIDHTLWLYAKREGKYFSLDEFMDNFAFKMDDFINFEPRHIKIIFDKYENDGAFQTKTDPIMGRHYSFREEYRKKIYDQIETEDSILWRVATYGRDLFAKALDGIDIDAELDKLQNSDNRFQAITIDQKATSIPASDRIVTLNDNKQAAALEAIDMVIDAVRGDNEYGHKAPEDKEQRIAELTAGKKLIEAARASISTVDAVLIKTLAYLSGIGVAVEQITDAMIKVKTLLGL